MWERIKGGRRKMKLDRLWLHKVKMTRIFMLISLSYSFSVRICIYSYSNKKYWEGKKEELGVIHQNKKPCMSISVTQISLRCRRDCFVLDHIFPNLPAALGAAVNSRCTAPVIKEHLSSMGYYERQYFPCNIGSIAWKGGVWYYHLMW